MTERKENLKSTQIAFFDADKTLWQVISTDGEDDWASKVEKPHFVSGGGNIVMRLVNNTKFILKDGVRECLERLAVEGIGLRIISDNRPEDVEDLTNLFGISDFFDARLTKVKLWVGLCPKEDYVRDVLKSSGLTNSSKALMVDDKDYSVAMIKNGYSFIQSPKDTFPQDVILNFFGIK